MDWVALQFAWRAISHSSSDRACASAPLSSGSLRGNQRPLSTRHHRPQTTHNGITDKITSVMFPHILLAAVISKLSLGQSSVFARSDDDVMMTSLDPPLTIAERARTLSSSSACFTRRASASMVSSSSARNGMESSNSDDDDDAVGVTR